MRSPPDSAAAKAALTPSQRERLRSMSKSVLGNMDRIEVCVAIALDPDGVVNATDLQPQVGIAQSRIRNQLVALAEGELLSAFPRTAGKQWYERVDSPFWEACLALHESWVR